MEESDHDTQKDEIIALESIFGPEMISKQSSDTISIAIPSFTASPRLDLSVSFPNKYPSSYPPVFQLASKPSNFLDISTLESLSHQLEALFHPGEVVLFSYIEFLQSEWENRAPPLPPNDLRSDINNNNASDMDHTQKNSEEEIQDLIHTLENGTLDSMEDKIVHGLPLTEKRSTFQAHLAPVTNSDQVKDVMETLLANKKIAGASHNISAYRIERDGAPGNYLQDCDDDGETAAGSRLLHLLQMVDAKNVVVVVSRWFGGILLGPARFGLINKVARTLLEEEGYIHKNQKKK